MTSDTEASCVRISCVVIRNMVNRLITNCMNAMGLIACKCCGRQQINTNQNRSTIDISNFVHFYEPVFNHIEVSIENETYFRAVNRSTAEEILQNRIDGSCLVRPFKENNELIKYIVSIYAKQHFFHLFIRYCDGMYAIGQEKCNEKMFHTPADAINFYRLNKLRCTNKEVTLSFFLVPIS